MPQLEPLAHDNGPIFQEAWQAQVLAMADSLIARGEIEATDWADMLGAKLRVHQGAEDTIEAYYSAALEALETLLATKGAASSEEQSDMKSAWIKAYENTPHGQPVNLKPASK